MDAGFSPVVNDNCQPCSDRPTCHLRSLSAGFELFSSQTRLTFLQPASAIIYFVYRLYPLDSNVSFVNAGFLHPVFSLPVSPPLECGWPETDRAGIIPSMSHLSSATS